MKRKTVSKLDLRIFKPGSSHQFWLSLVDDEFGRDLTIPILVMQGARPGPVLGITAAVHGNELNGIPVVHRVFREVDPEALAGTIIAAPVVNVPALQRGSREYIDGTDLNRIMPGKDGGNHSEIYAHNFFRKVVDSKMQYLIDLHTASEGRTNSYYIRADLSNEESGILAELQNAEIIVHSPPADGTLRGAAAEAGIPSITLEIGNPDVFQRKMIRSGYEGITNVMHFLGMLQGEILPPEESPVYCSKSYWIFTDEGGMLTVRPKLTDRVLKGDIIATQYDIFGENAVEYEAPEDGIVIGKSVRPFNLTGGRILHLGVPGDVSPN